MPLSNTSSLFSAALAAAWLVGCGGGSSATDGADQSSCTVELSGNTTDRAQTSACAVITNASDVDGGGSGFVLSIDTQTAAFGRLTASIDLGSAATTGQLSNESGMSWDALALTGSTDCAFQAGSDSVPNGTFTLTLTSIDLPNKTAHGTLALVTYVHAPPATDCGYGDTENIALQF